MKLDARQLRFLAAAIATLQGTRRQKDVAVAYAETGSEKVGAARLGMKPPTAKSHMQKFYRTNGVDCIEHVILLGCHNLLADAGHDQPESSSPPGS